MMTLSGTWNLPTLQTVVIMQPVKLKNMSVSRTIDCICYSSQLKKEKCKEQEEKEEERPQCLQCTAILSVPNRETVDELLPSF